MKPQKIAARAIRRFRCAEILKIILVQLAARVQPDFVQHAWEIHHPSGHFFRALRISRHREVNPISRSSAMIARLISKVPPLPKRREDACELQKLAQNRQDSSLDSHEVLWSAMRPRIGFQRESSDALIGS